MGRYRSLRSRDVAWGAVLAVARVELRQRWQALVGMGLLLGLIGGAALATLIVAQRTDTAFARLVTAVHRPDAVVHVMGDQDTLLAQVTALPGVAASWSPRVWVGHVHGDSLNYVSVMAGADHPADLIRPVVLKGRYPRAGSTDEVLLSEDYAGEFGFKVGSRIDLTLLTGEQVARFGVGFGAPAGPRVRLHVVGIGRMPLWGSDAGTALADSAFADRYRPSTAGRVSFLRLASGAGIQRSFDAQFNALAAANPPPKDLAELGPLQVRYPSENEDSLVAPARRVLGAGLVMSAVVAALAALLITVQALSRHHAHRVNSHRVEASLGMTRFERAAARTIAAVPGALAAASVGTAAGLASGILEPLGAMRAFEPTPGYLPPLKIALGGGMILAVVYLLLAGATAAAVLRGSSQGEGEPRGRRLLPLVWRSPVLLVGLRLASRDRRGRGLATFASAVGLATAVSLAVAVVTFGTSLDRLVVTPARYGWPAEITLMDAKEPDIARLAADRRVAAMDVVTSGEIHAGGDLVRTYAYEPAKGASRLTVISGRLPAAVDEVALGPRLADQLRVGRRGGEVAVRRGDGTTMMLRVVGIITNQPNDVAERLGMSAVLSPAALSDLAATPPLRNAYIQAVPGQLDALEASMRRDLEIFPRRTPPEITTLDGLRPLLDVMAVVITCGVATGIVHALRQARRRTNREMAIVQAVGFTSGNVGMVRMSMAAALVVPALLISVPVGVGIGRLVWWEVATASGVAGDALVPWAALTGAAAAVVVAGMVITAARIPGEQHTLAALRSE